MSEQIILEWAEDHVRVLSVDDSTGRRAVQVSARHSSSEHADPSVQAAAAGRDLRRRLDELGVGRGKTLVVLPREAVVVRRIHLPKAPEEELPDLVRFQTATKTSTPIDELALDFLTLHSEEQATGQDVVTFTIDHKRLSRMREVLDAAELSASQVTISPLSVANLVRHAGESGLDVTQPELVVFQDGPRIELSIFDEGTLVFSHATVLPEGSAAEHLKPLKSELSRSLVALTQAHPGVSIDRCYFVGNGDEAVVALLEKRFPGKFEWVRGERIFTGGQPGDEPLMGACLEGDRRLAIDLLHPRRRPVVQDRRKLYAGTGAAALVALLLIGYGIFLSQKVTLEASLEALHDQQRDLEDQLREGQPRAVAHDRVAKWAESKADQIHLWNEMRQHLPKTDRLYFREVHVLPQRGETVAKITGRGFARHRSDVDQMEQSLAENGFRVNPKAPRPGRQDPDYPVEFELDVERLRPIAAAARRGGGAGP